MKIRAPKRRSKLVLAGVLLALVGLAIAQSGGSYNLNWFTVAGGGGESAGSDYVLIGIVGQPAAGSVSGGTYTIRGGFFPSGTTHERTAAKVWLQYEP